jgi:hypothetical protein
VKWLALLGVIAAMGLAMLFTRGRPAEAPPVAVDIPAPSPAAALPAPAPPARSAAPRIELHGLVFLQGGGGASQALLSIDGQRAQAFHAGEPLQKGWLLRSIAKDHAIIANGAEQLRLEVVPAKGTAAAAAAASAPLPAERPLPGFVPAPPSAAAQPPAPSTETNRRFLQDRQKRAAGASP